MIIRIHNMCYLIIILQTHKKARVYLYSQKTRSNGNTSTSIHIFLIARANQQGFLYAIDVII